ncbi:MAG: hypothetical protein MUP36_02040 [Demequinaceae bacterium]|nr:hypothetical protein [Demequinaceae bacterium]
MKRALLLAALVSLSLGGCSSADNQTNASCDNVSFYLDPDLASGYRCEVVPQVSEEEAYQGIPTPEYVQITLQGYTLDRSAEIRVVPTADLVEQATDHWSTHPTDLQKLTAGGVGSIPVIEDPYGVPVFRGGSGWAFLSQVAVVAVDDGEGIRFLTEFHTGEPSPVDNNELMYTFEGMTENGEYWVEASLPITHSDLSDDSGDSSLGWTWEEILADLDAYYDAVALHLNSQTSDSFSPTIDALDALVASITIAP